VSTTVTARIPVSGTWKIDSVHSSATFTVMGTTSTPPAS
jgi:hypothetical protein